MKKHITVLLALFIFFTSTYTKTIVSGIILQNEWWSKDKSPYIVTNDIIVGANARLVIEPGVEVLIEKPKEITEGIDQYNHADSFTVSIRILGGFRCLGKPDEPIIFRSHYAKDSYGHWYGLVLNSKRSDEIIIGYTTITGATAGIDVQQGMPMIRHSIFEHNNIGIRCEGQSTARIFNSIFTDNFLAGIRVKDANPYIYNNIVAFNDAIGVWGDQRSKLDFAYNLVFGNEERDYVECSPLLGLLSQVNKNGDSTDYKHNLKQAPLFAGSPWEKRVIMERRKELESADKKDPEVHKILQKLKKAEAYESTYRFELSDLSPCEDAGNPDKQFEEANGTAADLGIWGGKDIMEYK